MRMTKRTNLKPNRGRGGTHPAKQLRNSQTFVCQPDYALGVSQTDVRTAIPYKDEAQADAVTNDPHLKLMFRLLKFEVQEEQDSAWDDSIVTDQDADWIPT